MMEGALRTIPAVTLQRRRIAAMIGLLTFLSLAVGTLLILGLRGSSQPPVAVLQAAHEIKAGSTIGAGDLKVTGISAQDSAVLGTLAHQSDRDHLLGQVALFDVPAGGLILTDLAVPAASAGMWRAALPVKRMPSGLKAGDHVAVLAEGNAGSGGVESVVMQDVIVLGVGPDSADLWLPAQSAPQVEWYADHGGVVLLLMSAGAIQSPVPPGGPA
jgi:hypothetical protein